MGNISKADRKSNFSEAAGLLVAAKETDRKSCAGCKLIGYDCGGRPECIRGYENICFKTDCLMRESE